MKTFSQLATSRDRQIAIVKFAGDEYKQVGTFDWPADGVLIEAVQSGRLFINDDANLVFGDGEVTCQHNQKPIGKLDGRDVYSVWLIDGNTKFVR